MRGCWSISFLFFFQVTYCSSRWFAILGPFPAATIDFSNPFSDLPRKRSPHRRLARLPKKQPIMTLSSHLSRNSISISRFILLLRFVGITCQCREFGLDSSQHVSFLSRIVTQAAFLSAARNVNFLPLLRRNKNATAERRRVAACQGYLDEPR